MLYSRAYVFHTLYNKNFCMPYYGPMLQTCFYCTVLLSTIQARNCERGDENRINERELTNKVRMETTSSPAQWPDKWQPKVTNARVRQCNKKQQSRTELSENIAYNIYAH